ncbi:hypothetical protein QQS21_011793 [Conoideocrella luteorostrata]|uniref:BTB domain-containing protein n=1 Tax=Conoideocrella luteorostrata TaxID=1105319 RepID=A0AAJ0CGZ2_9HYPO|nr:hypothetical protein QQS21_011793 [Conoideocrella luteorostrata]
MPPTDVHPAFEMAAAAQQGGDVDMTTGEVPDGAGPADDPVPDDQVDLKTTNQTIEPARETFMSYLASPIITLVVGQDDSQSPLTAHQGLLSKSPYFAEICRQFVDDDSPRQIKLLSEDAATVGSFLEYLYTNEYFPKKVPGQRSLENDPEMPAVDDTGVHLLKHARVYTLAEKFGVPELKKLSTSKIHCIDSTARGELAYARYVYAHTSNEDKKVRAPIASFWAARSHALRAEAEEEFKSLCLEYPQFGYDVLSTFTFTFSVLRLLLCKCANWGAGAPFFFYSACFG